MIAARRREVDMLLREWKEEVELRAAGATCPMPKCGALAISYEPVDSLREVVRQASDRWEFVCPECETEFTAPRADLVFREVPREWLFAEVCHA